MILVRTVVVQNDGKQNVRRVQSQKVEVFHKGQVGTCRFSLRSGDGLVHPVVSASICHRPGLNPKGLNNPGLQQPRMMDAGSGNIGCSAKFHVSLPPRNCCGLPCLLWGSAPRPSSSQSEWRRPDKATQMFAACANPTKPQPK